MVIIDFYESFKIYISNWQESEMHFFSSDNLGL